MKNIWIKLLLITLFLTFGSAWAAEIPAMTTDHVVFDFDTMPAGATTVADIKAAFPGSLLDNLVFKGRTGTGEYGAYTGGGRALALNASGVSLELIDPPDGVFGEADDLTITLTGESTEIGFATGDYSGVFNVNLFDGVTYVESYQVNSSNDPFFIQSDTPFNRIILTLLPEYPAGNWVVPALYIQKSADSPVSIPTINEWGMIIMSLMMAATALFMIKRQKV